MFPRFIHSLVIASGCSAVTVLGSLYAFSPAAQASTAEFAVPGAVLVVDGSGFSGSIVYQNDHPPVNPGQPDSGTTGAGTR